MQIIPANLLVPISSEQSASGLFVGMKVFDTTTGTPVQITGQPGQTNGVYPMVNLGSTQSYYVFFKGLPQHTYLFLVQEYTDGTYTTSTGTSQTQTASSEYIYPIVIQNLQVQIGCEDQPLQTPVVVSQNSDGKILLSFLDENGSMIDITQATSLTFKILEADGITILTKSLGVDISLVSGIINQALVDFDAADFALLPTGDNDVQVSITMSSVNTVLNVYSALTVEPSAI